MTLTTSKPVLLFDDPAIAYAELTKNLNSGDRWIQDFDYTIKEMPSAVGAKSLEDILPNSPVLAADGDIDSWEPSQGGLGICGSVASVCGYCAVPRNLPIALENGIYPQSRSPFGLYLIRMVDPSNPKAFKWVAIDSVMPVNSKGGLLFSWTVNGEPLAQTLLLKAMATVRGGCFDEITNSAKLGIKFPGWFPYLSKDVTTFAELRSALEKGAIGIITFNQQYDEATSAPITPPGIIYGHAFAVVDFFEVDGHQGVRIENPHGKSAKDFPTEYDDTSPFWSAHPELANKLADAKQGGGNWWMSFSQLSKMIPNGKIGLKIWTGEGV